MNLKVNREKVGQGAFRDFVSFLRLAGNEIVKMQGCGEYEIITCIRGKGKDNDWPNTFVAQRLN